MKKLKNSSAFIPIVMIGMLKSTAFFIVLTEGEKFSETEKAD